MGLNIVSEEGAKSDLWSRCPDKRPLTHGEMHHRGHCKLSETRNTFELGESSLPNLQEVCQSLTGSFMASRTSRNRFSLLKPVRKFKNSSGNNREVPYLQQDQCHAMHSLGKRQPRAPVLSTERLSERAELFFPLTSKHKTCCLVKLRIQIRTWHNHIKSLCHSKPAS